MPRRSCWLLGSGTQRSSRLSLSLCLALSLSLFFYVSLSLRLLLALVGRGGLDRRGLADPLLLRGLFFFFVLGVQSSDPLLLRGRSFLCVLGVQSSVLAGGLGVYLGCTVWGLQISSFCGEGGGGRV